MNTINTITVRKILNSHVNYTNEFIIEHTDGSIGIGGSPKGETISIYEDKQVTIRPETIIKTIKEDGYIGKPIEQEDFDAYLQRRISFFGKNNAFALSLANFEARKKAGALPDVWNRPRKDLHPPCICLNILNGGQHAYTNPVLSDFPEYILVARSNNLKEVIEDHNMIQQVVREKLNKQPKTVVSGNLVNRFVTSDNRECIEFLLNICNSLGLSRKFDLMIDASGTDLLTDEGYQFTITDNNHYSKEEFLEYWLDIIEQYDLRFLEDPFCEEDYENWQQLTTSQESCKVIGDNLYSSDVKRLEQGVKQRYTHGVIIKPNQAGTVTDVCRVIEVAQQNNQIAITSHRSISTESTFLSNLTCKYGVGYIKIGPLTTDYSAVLRFNEIIRITEGLLCQ